MTTIADLFDHINKKSFKGNLEIVNEIKSVNCKEWEAERKYLEMVEGKRFPMATRYYVKIKNLDGIKAEGHYHTGHIDFRSISPSISDAFLPIPRKERFYVTCQKSYKSDDPFNPTVLTVPYATPTREFSFCSPASMWIVLTTLSYEFGKEYLSLVAINNCLSNKSAGGAVELKEYNKLFNNFNYSPNYYLGKKKQEYYEACEGQISKCEKNDPDCSIGSFYWMYRETQEDINELLLDWEVLYAYIESEIPVYLVFKWNDLRKRLNCGKPDEDYHSVVAIGHTLDEKSNVSNFIIHDVSCAPFLEIPKDMIDNELYEALVILPSDVTIRYEKVQIILSKIIKMYNTIFDTILEGGSKLFSRPFLMRSQRIKFWYMNNIYPTEVREMYSKADFPPYVWVFEIRTPKLKEKDRCIGQIIIDATKPEESMGLVLMNFPKFRLWYENKVMMEPPIEKAAFEDLPLFRDRLAIK